MAVFVDPRSGEVFSNVPDEEAERARREFGLVSQEEYATQQTAEQADESIGPLETIGKAFQRGVGARAEAIQSLTGFGTAPGLDEDEHGNKLPGGGLTSLQDAYSPEARADAAAHPILAGVGQGLASAGETVLGGAALGAVAPVATALGTSVGAVVGEALPQAVLQEYDDAWLEQRPMQLQSVAANTLMFAGIDFAFRGALKGIGSAFTGKPAVKPSIGSRNVVSEAQGAAREFGVEPAGGGSVGAASAQDLAEPFDDAIRQMSDRDAAVLARDANDHLHLISQDASEAFTRLNNGLSDNLGSQLKYEDFAQYAENFEPKMLERQAEWFTSVGESAEDAARQITEGPYDFGNLGAKASQLISTFTRRIAEEADAGRRLVLGDEFKKRLDALTMSIDGSFGVDNVTRAELKALIEPTRETLRAGLQNRKLFGEAAELQRSLNEPWHHLLESWRKVQSTLTEATGHVQFDVSGAGRVTRESTVDRMLGLLGKDPRSNQEFGRHLARSLEGVQGLIDARQAHGISRLDGLDEMASDIRNLMEDWNLASTVGVAKNRVDALKRDPRKWATLALNLGERLPIVGQPIQLARTLGNAFTDLHIEKGTPLARVWDSAYKRYALNPVYSDPSIIRNYPDWIAESLRQRGGNFTPPTGTAAPAPMVPGMPPANEGAVRGVAQPVLSARGKAAIARARARASQGGVVHIGSNVNALAEPLQPVTDADVLATKVSSSTGSTDGGMFRGSDGVERYVKFMPQDEALNEAATARAYADLGVDHLQHTTATGGPQGHMLLSERMGPEWKPLHMHNGPITGTMARQFLEGIPADIVLGNVDRALNLGNVMTNGKDLIRIDAGIAGPYVLSKPSMRGQASVKGMWDELLAPVVEGAPEGLAEGPRALATEGGIKSLEAARSALESGVARLEAGLTKAGGARAFVQARYPHLSPADQSAFAKQLEQRVRAVKANVAKIARGMAENGFIVLGDGPNFTLGDVLRSPMGVVTGAGAAGLAINAAVQARAAERPQTPDHAYRDALKEIDTAGQRQIRDFASAALRTKPPRGKDRDPLALFAGKRSVQDAVEESRERLDEIAADPTTLIQQLGSSAGALSKTHPGVYMAATEKAALIAGYLQSVMPRRTGATLLDPRGAPVSFDRAWDYAARFVGATQPRVAMREVVRGTAPPEMLEALAQNWPEVWDGFRIEMLGQVQRMHAAGKHIPAERLRRWDSMLGLRGQLDPSASVEVAQHFLAAQDAEMARRQQQAQGGKPPAAGGSARAALRTTLDSVNQERAT